MPGIKRKKPGMVGLFLRFSVGSWFSAALSFFTTPIVTALIVPADFGKASMFILAYSFALQIVLLGADQSFVRKFYEKKFEFNRGALLQNCLWPALVAGSFLGIVCLLFWQPISRLLIETADFQICLLLAIAILLGVLERYAVLVVRMYKKGLLFSMLRVVASIITFLVVIIYCRYVERSMYAIVYSICIPLGVTAVIAIFLERRLWFGKYQIEGETVRSVLKYGIPFIPTFLAYWLFEGIDKIALRRFSNFEEIGLFAAAFKIVALLSILQVSFSTFWAPVAYEAYEKQSDEAKKVFRQTFGYLSLALFMAGIGIMLGRDIIMLFFDEAYRGASYIMPFLLLVPIMYTMSEVTVGGINFRNKTHLHLVITVVVAAVNIAGNFMLVPSMGAKGAAIATGFSYILFFFCRTFLSVRLFPVDFGAKRIVISLVIFLLNAWIHSFYAIAWWNIAVSLFLAGMLLLFYKEELHFLYSSAMSKLKIA